jgi:hypothetical protein
MVHVLLKLQDGGFGFQKKLSWPLSGVFFWGGFDTFSSGTGS